MSINYIIVFGHYVLYFLLFDAFRPYLRVINIAIKIFVVRLSYIPKYIQYFPDELVSLFVYCLMDLFQLNCD